MINKRDHYPSAFLRALRFHLRNEFHSLHEACKMNPVAKRLAALALFSVTGLSSLSGVSGESKGWTTGGPKGNGFWVLTARDKDLFVASTLGLYKSTTRGNQWHLSLATGQPLSQPVTSVTIDPRNPSVVFATIDSGDAKPLFKSTDGGLSWKAMTAGLVLPYSSWDDRIYRISSLVIDPQDSSVVYAGTAPGVNGPLYGSIMKSIDGGENWQRVSPNIFMGCVLDLAIDPGDPRTLYAVNAACDTNNRSAVFKSTDAGSTWSRIGVGLPSDPPVRFPPPAFTTLVLDPADHSTLYLATTEHGVYRTRDAGATWQPINDGLPRLSGLSDYPIVEALSWGRGGVLYAGLDPYGLFKSVDGGDHWMPLNFGSPITGLSVVDRERDTNDGDHRNGQLIYVAAPRGIYLSTDGGASWSAAGDGIIGSEVSALATDPTMPGAVYAGTRSFSPTYEVDPEDGRWTPPNPPRAGVFRSVDRGRTWSHTGSPPGLVYGLAVDSRSGSVYASMSGGYLFKSEDHGTTWKDLHWPFFIELLTVAIDPNHSMIYVGTSGFGVFKTEDDGHSWHVVNSDLNVVFSLAIDPHDTRVIFAGTDYRGVYKTVDGGGTWAQVNNGLTYEVGGHPYTQTVSRVAIDPSRPQTIYAAALCTGDLRTGGVFKSDDGGMNWRSVGDGLQTFESRIVWDVAIDPRNSHDVYIATFDGVFQINGDETSWLPMNFGLRTQRILVDPLPPGTLYAGTDAGVFTLDPLPDAKPSTAKRTPQEGRQFVPSLIPVSQP
jgi:photosystem II stability/assembly factor-like uncharacterized protein